MRNDIEPDDAPSPHEAIGVVVIGRNEGERLIACLKSVAAPGRHIVYVDSGSTDGSVRAARDLGADALALDMTLPFTAARARNAGYARLREAAAPRFVFFIDGDCVLAPGFLDQAARVFADAPRIAVACGRRREARPAASLFNGLIDREWATPVGDALACGGDALMRADAFEAAGGFRESLIAGEEPELCVRLRAAGWKIRRLDAEMTLHDIAMTSLGQWLKRARRAGHAFAEVSSLHAGKPEAIWRRETLRAFAWTAFAPIAAALAIFAHPAFAALFLLYPLQIVRLAMKSGGSGDDFAHAALIVAQKPWEAAGAAQFFIGKLTKNRAALIEYKSPLGEAGHER